MRRTAVNCIAIVAFAALCSMWTTSQSIAEPISGAGVGVAPETTGQSQEVTDAAARFKDRDVPGALKLLKEAASKNADLPPAQLMLAQWFSQVNNPADARRSLEQAVVASPDDPEVYVIMGDIALREGRITEADMLLQKASGLIAKFSKSKKRKDILQPQILGGLAAVDEARDNWSSAQKQLEAWLKLNPKSAVAMQGLARCLFQQKDAKGALEMLKAAKKEDSSVLTPQAILAQLYEQANDRENAKKWMIAALEESPKDLKTRLVVGQWALQTNQLEEAKTQAATALQIDPKSLDAKVLSGVIALLEKDYPTAERYFEAAHLQSPRAFSASNNLALALIEQKDETKKRRALEYAENNVQQYPKVAEAASTYGWVLYKLGRLDDAEKALQAAISGGSFTPDTAYYIARLSYDRGRESQAKQWLDIALKSNAPFAMRSEAKALLEQLKK
jgi:Tfp pilus assembly protein PilF